jgi:hypothetical protein
MPPTRDSGTTIELPQKRPPGLESRCNATQTQRSFHRPVDQRETLAKLRVLQSAQLEGRLLDREMVLAHWATAFASLRDRALAMSDRIAARGANRSADELRGIVSEEVRESARSGVQWTILSASGERSSRRLGPRLHRPTFPSLSGRGQPRLGQQLPAGRATPLTDDTVRAGAAGTAFAALADPARDHSEGGAVRGHGDRVEHHRLLHGGGGIADSLRRSRRFRWRKNSAAKD